MIKAQQLNMELGASPVVNLGQDKAWIVMRQIVARLIAEEQGRSRQRRARLPRRASSCGLTAGRRFPRRAERAGPPGKGSSRPGYLAIAGLLRWPGGSA